MIKGFKEFLMRGNVVDLAVAVVMGTALLAVVNAIVDGFITPLIAAIFGEPSLVDVGNFTLNGAEFKIGLILDGILTFLMVAAGVYFVIVTPINRLAARRRRGAEVVEEPSEEIALLREIRDSLRHRSP
jgi:large conductance mechanosensitive channel